MPFGIFSAEAGPEGPDQKISGGSEDDQMKFSYLAVFPPGNSVGILGKTVRGARGGYAIPARVLLRSRRLSSNFSCV